MSFRSLLMACLFFGSAGCVSTPTATVPQQDLGVLWVNYAAEYGAVTQQLYREAEEDLSRFLADRFWSALPGQTGAEDLPPAIILDVDETALSNRLFQLMHSRPYTVIDLYEWHRHREVDPVPGFARFAATARLAGVQLLFVTNRPCLSRPELLDPCPYQRTTRDQLRKAGVMAELEHILHEGEKDDWTREKQVRREYLARDYRILMLIGDDLGDFIPCVHGSPDEPCAGGSDRSQRARLAEESTAYWGEGWYILPNPMHGSWTTVK